MDLTISSADGTHLAVRRFGEGAPIVLVHGSSGGLSSWDAVAADLATDHEVWVYARRGYAPSGGAGRTKSFADDAADLTAILHAAGGGAHVAAASYGATVALHAVCTGVDILSLTLFEPPLFAAGPELAPVLHDYRALLTEGQLHAAARLFAERVSLVPEPLLNKIFGPSDRSVPDVSDPAAASKATGCLHDLEAMTGDTPDTTRWRQVHTPTLLLQGAQTWHPMPAAMDALAEAMPEAERVVLDGQSHFATHTAPALVANVVRGHITQLRTNRGRHVRHGR